MRISQLLTTSKRPFPSLEIVPPLSKLVKEDLYRMLDVFEGGCKYVNVTSHMDEFQFVPDGNGGFTRHLVRNRISPVAVCSVILARYDVEVIPHVICGGYSAEEIDSLLSDFNFMGINNVMALRGDSLVGEKRFSPVSGGYAHASELVEGIRRFETENGCHFCIGVGGYPEKHFEAVNIETDIKNLALKVKAGADYITTQMFFDNEKFYDFVARCRAEGITVPVVPGIKPLTTEKQLSYLPSAFHISLPVELTSVASGSKEKIKDAGLEWCVAQCKDLIAHGFPNIHYYVVNSAQSVKSVIDKVF